MENASKALLIAGAILLVILIISLGLVVYNQAKESVGSANLNQQEIEAFNSKFTAYEGNGISGSQVNQLIQTVISSNQAAKNSGENTGVYIKFPSITEQSGGNPSGGNPIIQIIKFDSSTGNAMDNATAANRVNTGVTYDVKFEYKDGLVSGIIANTAGTSTIAFE